MGEGFSNMLNEIKSSDFPILILGDEAVSFFKKNYKKDIINISDIVITEKGYSGIVELNRIVDFSIFIKFLKNSNKTICLSKEEPPLQIILCFSKIIKYREVDSFYSFIDLNKFQLINSKEETGSSNFEEYPQIKFSKRKLEAYKYSPKLLYLME